MLIDPLVDGEDDPLLPKLDALVEQRVRVLISIPISHPECRAAVATLPGQEALIMGHCLVAKRLTDRAGFQAMEAGKAEGVVRFHRIGRPVRAEMPIEIPSLRALVFGDAVVEAGESYASGRRPWRAREGGAGTRRSCCPPWNRWWN